jgi:hypothetical protein
LDHSQIKTQKELDLLFKYIWDKEGGKDVGHTAIRIGDNVYGYYPSDENGNGGYDNGELFGSKGEMHINTVKEFSQLYNGQAITSFDIELSNKQAKSLQANLDNIANNPGTYSLRGNNCTSVAINALINSGVKINAPINQGDRPIWTGKIAPLKNGFGQSPAGLRTILEMPSNTATFYYKTRFFVH